MATKHCSAKSLQWIWVIESLASLEQVDASLLIDLIRRTPEIFDDLGKNAREMLSLRILESLFAQRNGITSGVSSTSISTIGLDPSDCCEDVLRRTWCEISASNLKFDGPEMLKWDVHAFIMHKRACLPKHALQQLKDKILEGSHPILAPLKERSGLAIKSQSGDRILVNGGNFNAVSRRLEGSNSDGQIMAAQGNLISSTPENEDGLLQENSPTRNLLPFKRDRSDLTTENLASQFHEDRIGMDNGHDPHFHDAKKPKQDVTCTTQAIGQNSVPPGNELLEASSNRCGQHTGRDGCDLAKVSQVGGLEESMFSKGNQDEHITLKRPGQSNDAIADYFQHDHQLISHKKKTIQDTSGDGLHQNISVDEAKDGNDRFAEMRSNGASPDGCHCKKNSDKVKDDIEHNHELEMSSDSAEYDNEKISVAMKKCSFLNTQCTFSQDSLATADWMELNLCIKCTKSGQVLTCGTSTCPLVVHESCLGSAASFDERGNFYCPFCAYRRAISEYLEVKKKASLARKEMIAFIGMGNEHRPNQLSKRLRSEQNQLRQDGDVDGNNEADYRGDNVNKVNYCQCRTNIEDKREVEPSAFCINSNLPCGEQKATRIDGTVRVTTADSLEGEKIGQECQSARRVTETQDTELQADRKHGGNSSSCIETEIVHPSERRYADIRFQQDVLQPNQPITGSSHKAACLPIIDEEESSEEDDDNSVASKYFIRFRTREKQYTYPAIPQLRRKKVPWTQVEEEMLKEGVRRFSSAHDRNIPWKKILEFGGNVFLKGRTTIDLKDKWRNICRSPKSK